MLVAQIVRISKSPSSNLLQQIKEVNVFCFKKEIIRVVLLDTFIIPVNILD